VSAERQAQVELQLYERILNRQANSERNPAHTAMETMRENIEFFSPTLYLSGGARLTARPIKNGTGLTWTYEEIHEYKHCYSANWRVNYGYG
jgi:hypothetical protein